MTPTRNTNFLQPGKGDVGYEEDSRPGKILNFTTNKRDGGASAKTGAQGHTPPKRAAASSTKTIPTVAYQGVPGD